MGNYICKHCNFRVNKKYRECPWCGRDTLIPEPSASEILNDVDDILNEKE